MKDSHKKKPTFFAVCAGRNAILTVSAQSSGLPFNPSTSHTSKCWYGDSRRKDHADLHQKGLNYARSDAYTETRENGLLLQGYQLHKGFQIFKRRVPSVRGLKITFPQNSVTLAWVEVWDSFPGLSQKQLLRAGEEDDD